MDVLCKLRIGAGEVDVLLDAVPLEALSGPNVVAIVNALTDRGDAQDALVLTTSWLEPRESSYETNEVEQLRRRLLKTLGRGEKAFSEMKALFDEHPSCSEFEQLLELTPESEWDDTSAWAVSKLEMWPYQLVEVAAKTQYVGVVASPIAELSTAELSKISSWTLTAAAKALDPQCPRSAVKVYSALGWRHVGRGKAQYYYLAVEAFRRAGELHAQLGERRAWEKLVADVTAEHGRKYSFMPAFRALVKRLSVS